MTVKEVTDVTSISSTTPSPNLSIDSDSHESPVEYKVYKRRWLMLFLFSVTSGANAFPGIAFSIVVDTVTEFYDVSHLSVDWLSMIYMLVYILFLVPGELLQKKGLRLIVLLASLGTTAGAWIRIGSLAPNRFYVNFIGQSFIALSQIFVLAIPPRLAAVWFGPKQVSTACSIGVFGNQLGVAVAFLIPPLIVPSDTPPSEVQTKLSILLYSFAVFNTILSLLVIFCFQNEPPTPPSQARAAAMEEDAISLKQSIINLFKNRSYVLLFFTYGVNAGIFYSISTLLGQLILPHFPHNDRDAGIIGLLMVLFGMAGSVLCGIWLDRTRKYKLTMLIVYIFSFLGMIAFALTLFIPHISVVYVTACILGFFMTGYFPLAMELASEITYPEPESTSSGLLNVCSNFCGIVFTFIASQLLAHLPKHTGDLAVNMSFAGALFLGVVLSAFIKSDLKRQNMEECSPNQPKSIQN